jgi:hypothetical protein
MSKLALNFLYQDSMLGFSLNTSLLVNLHVKKFLLNYFLYTHLKVLPPTRIILRFSFLLLTLFAILREWNGTLEMKSEAALEIAMEE